MTFGNTHFRHWWGFENTADPEQHRLEALEITYKQLFINRCYTLTKIHKLSSRLIYFLLFEIYLLAFFFNGQSWRLQCHHHWTHIKSDYNLFMFSTRSMVKGKQAKLKMGSGSFNPAYTDESRTQWYRQRKSNFRCWKLWMDPQGVERGSFLRQEVVLVILNLLRTKQTRDGVFHLSSMSKLRVTLASKWDAPLFTKYWERISHLETGLTYLLVTQNSFLFSFTLELK